MVDVYCIELYILVSSDIVKLLNAVNKARDCIIKYTVLEHLFSKFPIVIAESSGRQGGKCR